MGIAMGNTENLPPEYEAAYHIMLLPPSYHDRDDDATYRSDGAVKPGKSLPSGKTAGAISKYWRWLAEEMALSTERHGKSKSIHACMSYVYTYIWQSGTTSGSI
ncbi:hypothetical protein ACQKWADRAFT_155375 [Trichoderma austrokoningii]